MTLTNWLTFALFDKSMRISTFNNQTSNYIVNMVILISNNIMIQLIWTLFWMASQVIVSIVVGQDNVEETNRLVDMAHINDKIWYFYVEFPLKFGTFNAISKTIDFLNSFVLQWTFKNYYERNLIYKLKTFQFLFSIEYINILGHPNSIKHSVK